MNHEKFFTIGSIILAVVLVGLLACEVMFPLSGTAWLHKLMG